ncbi:hypothetical protein K0M31_014448 [Melipona bicolor]|uniref:Uncharacterized protein n=1 Tax=Melipona bicolor TaxID=60889 RepID=A0AA40G8K3_9HYME|nr:hypothetical protein K0M31_014448 [Melipona bicolor]
MNGGEARPAGPADCTLRNRATRHRTSSLAAPLLPFNHVPYNAQQKTVIRNPSTLDAKNPYVRVQLADDCRLTAAEKIEAEGEVGSIGG